MNLLMLMLFNPSNGGEGTAPDIPYLVFEASGNFIGIEGTSDVIILEE